MRLGALVLLGIVLFGGFVAHHSQGQSGLPDLTIKTLRVSPGELEDGQPALLRAVIINKGQGDAMGSFDVVFELDGQEIATRSLFELKKGQTAEFQLPWQALAGTHIFTVSVDAPLNTIRESSETNNKLSLQFAVSPVAGVRSFSLDLVKLFTRTLDEAGQALHFQLTDNVFTSIDNAVGALHDAATALRNASLELELLRRAVPAALANDPLYSDAETIVALVETLAGSFERIGGALSIGNFDGVLENAQMVRQHLVKLSNHNLAGTRFAPLQAAIAQFDRVIALATELHNLLKGAQGRSQYQVAVELFQAFTAFGDLLRVCAREIVQHAATFSARFYNGDEALNGRYNTNRVLTIRWPGIILMRLEIYELTSGHMVYQSEEIGPVLEWASNGSLSQGAYGYKLIGMSKQGVGRREIGRLQVKGASTIPPLLKHDAPMGMSGH